MILLHGTTQVRADGIKQNGPKPRYHEPHGHGVDEGFSMTLENGPFLFGTPEEYARGKSLQFPEEGGPVILTVDVPDEIIAAAVSDWFPLSQGLVQFDLGRGLKELVLAWPTLLKEIRSIP